MVIRFIIIIERQLDHLRLNIHDNSGEGCMLCQVKGVFGFSEKSKIFVFSFNSNVDIYFLEKS